MCGFVIFTALHPKTPIAPQQKHSKLHSVLSFYNTNNCTPTKLKNHHKLSGGVLRTVLDLDFFNGACYVPYTQTQICCTFYITRTAKMVQHLPLTVQANCILNSGLVWVVLTYRRSRIPKLKKPPPLWERFLLLLQQIDYRTFVMSVSMYKVAPPDV